jgi:hypothetical protein
MLPSPLLWPLHLVAPGKEVQWLVVLGDGESAVTGQAGGDLAGVVLVEKMTSEWEVEHGGGAQA